MDFSGSSPETLFKEACESFTDGDREHAYELFSYLVKVDPLDVRFWLWLSAVKAPGKERIDCLREALRLDANNQMALRGLLLEGQLSPEEMTRLKPIPVQAQRRSWTTRMESPASSAVPGNNLFKFWPIFVGGAGLFLICCLLAFGAFWQFSRKNTPTPTIAVMPPAIDPTYIRTYTPSPTLTPNLTSLAATPAIIMRTEPAITVVTVNAAITPSQVPYTPTPTAIPFTPSPTRTFTATVARTQTTFTPTRTITPLFRK